MSLTAWRRFSVSLITHRSKCQGSWKDTLLSGLLFPVSRLFFPISACIAVNREPSTTTKRLNIVSSVFANRDEARKITICFFSLCTWFKSPPSDTHAASSQGSLQHSLQKVKPFMIQVRFRETALSVPLYSTSNTCSIGRTNLVEKIIIHYMYDFKCFFWHFLNDSIFKSDYQKSWSLILFSTASKTHNANETGRRISVVVSNTTRFHDCRQLSLRLTAISLVWVHTFSSCLESELSPCVTKSILPSGLQSE